ncbi:hypothetical protein HEQ72_03935 [Haematospirillum sp. 15-248]|uniref:hypothetical protein n=1 Tax=Haematospirillum sp. 15-248 TaxID=2723107 RepID=UPI00143B506A|nr:hypothetical protein [Haematospirillum sp. 15-248]NKD87460.1 hypothetical protein [Haematospirillum sp. 15-248]
MGFLVSVDTIKGFMNIPVRKKEPMVPTAPLRPGAGLPTIESSSFFRTGAGPMASFMAVFGVSLCIAVLAAAALRHRAVAEAKVRGGHRSSRH